MNYYHFLPRIKLYWRQMSVYKLDKKVKAEVMWGLQDVNT